MAVFKCKMCGGDLKISAGATFAVCDYCGTKQTPSKDNEEHTPRTVIIKETVIAGAPAVPSGPVDVDALLKRVFMFLKEGKWDSANEYCEKVLDAEPENVQAYLGKLMVERRARVKEELKDCTQSFENSKHYQKLLSFEDEALKEELAGYIAHINARNENARFAGIYSYAEKALESGKERDCLEAAQMLEDISTYRDSALLAQKCRDRADIARKDRILEEGKRKMLGNRLGDYQEASQLFQSISGWKDASAQAAVCQEKIEQLRIREEKNRLDQSLRTEKTSGKNLSRIAIFAAIGLVALIALILISLILLCVIIIPGIQHLQGDTLMTLTTGLRL